MCIFFFQFLEILICFSKVLATHCSYSKIRVKIKVIYVCMYGYQAWVGPCILTTSSACSTKILLDSCRVFLEYTAIDNRNPKIAKSVLWVFERAQRRPTDEFLCPHKFEWTFYIWKEIGKSASFNMCIQYFSSFFVLRCLLIFNFGYKYISKSISPLLNISHSLRSMAVLVGRKK